MSVLASKAMGQYKQVGMDINAASASPHQLIEMLFDGVLEKISVAKGAIERADIEVKGMKIGGAITIIDGLRASLDKGSGEELAENLDNLYIYMQRRLLEANLTNDLTVLNEVSGLLGDVRSAWIAIPGSLR